MRTIQYGLVNSAMGQIPCSTERISCYVIYSTLFAVDQYHNKKEYMKERERETEKNKQKKTNTSKKITH